MSIVDKFLDSLIKFLQKKQRNRKRLKKKAKKFPPKRPAKVKKKKVVKKSLSSRKTLKRTPVKKKKKKSVPTKPSKRKTPAKKPKAPQKVSKSDIESNDVLVGEITHYFSRIQVVVVKMTNGRLCIGDQIFIRGRTTNFSQKISSLQIESVDVKSARKGQLVGLKVKKTPKVGDQVFKR